MHSGAHLTRHNSNIHSNLNVLYTCTCTVHPACILLHRIRSCVCLTDWTLCCRKRLLNQKGIHRKIYIYTGIILWRGKARQYGSFSFFLVAIKGKMNPSPMESNVSAVHAKETDWKKTRKLSLWKEKATGNSSLDTVNSLATNIKTAFWCRQTTE